MGISKVGEMIRVMDMNDLIDLDVNNSSMNSCVSRVSKICSVM